MPLKSTFVPSHRERAMPPSHRRVRGSCHSTSRAVLCLPHHGLSEFLRIVSVVFVLCVMMISVPQVQATGASSAAATGEPVYLLNAVYSKRESTSSGALPSWLGVQAALYAGQIGGGGRPIKIVEPDIHDSLEDIVGTVKKALQMYPNLLAVIGPYSDDRLRAVLADSEIQQKGLMFLSPFTASSSVRNWDDRLYFMRAEPRMEVLTILQYITCNLGVRRMAFMYVAGVDFGDLEYNYAQSMLKDLGADPCAVYAVPYSPTDFSVNRTAFDELAMTNPQVIIVWAHPQPQTQEFLRTVWTDPRTSSAYVLTPFELQQMVFQTYYDLAAMGQLTPEDGKVISSATSYPVSAEGPKHLEIFKEQMWRYMEEAKTVNVSIWASEAEAVRRFGEASVVSPVSPAEEFFTNYPCVANEMLSGWIAGSVIWETLSHAKWIENRSTYRSYLFRQNRYLVGEDFVLGDYGGECDETASFLGALCRCNQGGHTTFIDVLQKASWVVDLDSSLGYSQQSCYSTHISLTKTVSFSLLRFQDHPALLRAADEFFEVMQYIFGYVRYSQLSVAVDSLAVTDDTVNDLVSSQLHDKFINIMSGMMMKDLNLQSLLVPSPIFPHPGLTLPRRNLLYLMPTLEQQIYLLYANINDICGVTSVEPKVCLVLHGYEESEAAPITALVIKTAATFNQDNPSVVSVLAERSVALALRSSEINLVLGVQVDDVDSIVAFLVANPSAVVVITFDDLSLSYMELVQAFSSYSRSVQRRLVSFSNLPLWSDTSPAAQAASSLLQLFSGAMPDVSNHTPFMLSATTSLLFVMNFVNSTRRTSSADLLSEIYENGVMSLYDLTFGTFAWGCMVSQSGTDCRYNNFGARDIVTLTMERMLDPAVPVLATAITPSMEYRPRQLSGLTPAQRNGLIAGCILGGVGLAAAVGLLFHCCRESRNNDAAPKDNREPLTVLFTDIESSTAMWGAMPQLMADAIAAHHWLIRQSIRKHGCYEVKTIGDSFMIACKDAYTAVRLASDVQTRLLEYDWNTTDIDRNYRDFERKRAEELREYVPPTAGLDEAEYDALWRGLRVRMGLHTGLSDIRYDEVTKGYDYYGETSNMAARTEAIANGGQVLATEVSWWAMSDAERDTVAHSSLGPQGLRGVPHVVAIYQLNPVPGRRHAALRTEIDAILPDYGLSETGSCGVEAMLSSAGTMTHTSESIALVIASCFAPYPAAQRLRELQPMLNKWAIGTPPRGRGVGEEDYFKSLLNRLAVRIAHTIHARICIEGAHDSSRLVSPYASSSRRGLPSVHVAGCPVVDCVETSSSALRMRSGNPLGTPTSHARYSPKGFLLPMGIRRENRRPSAVTLLEDPVTPFNTISAPTVSLESSGVLGATGSSTEAVMVQMPTALHRRPHGGEIP